MSPSTPPDMDDPIELRPGWQVAVILVAYCAALALGAYLRGV